MAPRLTLFDMSTRMCEAFAQEFFEYEGVAIVHAKVDELDPHDCIVSPANSFGMMDGGLDAALSAMMPDVQEYVHEALERQFFGEQPVGTSVIVNTGSERFPLLAHTPTMRYPRRVADEVVYDAMRALLIAVEAFNADFDSDDLKIQTVACPGLGTRSGGVSSQRGAHMMRVAYDSIYRDQPYIYTDWRGDISDHLRTIYRGG
jgi:O-acetyl-ADP-ribose deacetylase (regulator of RNase III)